jgi:o-succinylbenzoate---CoA ligase
MEYPFPTLQLNNREISIPHILDGSVSAVNEFEANTMSFVREWLAGRDEFNIQTSGSTGKPKQIRITRRQMEESARATANALSLTRGASALVCLDTRYIAGRMMLVRCLTNGLSIHAVTPSANPLWNLEWGKDIQFVAFVPYQLHAILKSDVAVKLNSIEKIIVGGAALSVEDELQLERFDCQTFVTYGMTETISHIALRRVNGPLKSDLYHTLPGITVDVDERNCLIANCPYISDKVITNDIIKLHNQTTFEWIGRFDNVINTGGVKVHPEELERRLETILLKLNLHGRVIVSSVSDPSLGEKVVLILEGDPIETDQKREILKVLRQNLPKFESPYDLFTVLTFPQTKGGKINRLELKNLLSRRLLS